MKGRKKLLVFILIALVLASVPAFLAARPASARATLKADKGQAVWFFRSCEDGHTGEVATWAVDLAPGVTDQTSLRIQVGNAFPGYRLSCSLYFVNSGKIPFLVKDITVNNPNSEDLLLSATLPRAEQGRVLEPCRYRPIWDSIPLSVPCACRSRIDVTLALGPNVDENSRLDFGIQVRLEEEIDD
jgi:hypothetical protein